MKTENRSGYQRRVRFVNYEPPTPARRCGAHDETQETSLDHKVT